jgi:hypothetical protein
MYTNSGYGMIGLMSGVVVDSGDGVTHIVIAKTI